MKNAYTNVNAKVTPQTQPIPGETQVINHAGGYVFELDKWARLNRFLILGSAGGTYYVNEAEHTQENFKNVAALVQEDGERFVHAIMDVLKNDRAIKPDPALFALAYAAGKGDAKTRPFALSQVSSLCRIPTQLFHFVQYATQFRGWGRGLRKAVSAWYESKDLADLEYHVIKYQGRDGWTHADLIRLAHPKIDKMLAYWVLGKVQEGSDFGNLPRILSFERAKRAKTEAEIITEIVNHDLPRECIPTQWLNSAAVWEALLEKMPYTAMVRNLGKMSAIGLIDTFSDASKKVVASLTDAERVKKSHIHPMAVLVAQKTYAQGHGDKGSLTWKVNALVSNALDDAFYLAMGNVKGTGKKLLVGVDESGSMSAAVSGLPLSAREAAAAMAMVHVHAEDEIEVMAYDTKARPIAISKRDTLDKVIRLFANGGGTDCTLPIKYAAAQKHTFDAIISYTDEETWAGEAHVCQWADAYRHERNHGLKFVVGAMTATSSRLTRPADSHSLEVVGFDLNTPEVVRQFIAGEL